MVDIDFISLEMSSNRRKLRPFELFSESEIDFPCRHFYSVNIVLTDEFLNQRFYHKRLLTRQSVSATPPIINTQMFSLVHSGKISTFLTRITFIQCVPHGWVGAIFSPDLAGAA